MSSTIRLQPFDKDQVLLTDPDTYTVTISTVGQVTDATGNVTYYPIGYPAMCEEIATYIARRWSNIYSSTTYKKDMTKGAQDVISKDWKYEISSSFIGKMKAYQATAHSWKSGMTKRYQIVTNTQGGYFLLDGNDTTRADPPFAGDRKLVLKLTDCFSPTTTHAFEGELKVEFDKGNERKRIIAGIPSVVISTSPTEVTKAQTPQPDSQWWKETVICKGLLDLEVDPGMKSSLDPCRTAEISRRLLLAATDPNCRIIFHEMPSENSGKSLGGWDECLIRPLAQTESVVETSQ